jgi:Outer membrane protein beta-barrel domain
VELLAAFSTEPSGRRRFFGPRVSVGVAAGATLTPDFARYQFNGITTSGTVSSPFMDTSASGPRSFIGGPEVEVSLGRGFSVEADAIYRPERLQGTFDSNGTSDSYNRSMTTWQFPFLGKYQIGHGRFQPFLEAGPSFRLASGLANAASYGATGAAGVETHLSRLVIAPAVRFSRWGPNITEIVNEVRNEAELVAGFTF